MTISGTTSLTRLSLGGVSGSVTCNPNVTTNGVTINGDVSGTLDLVGATSSSTGGLTINGDITSTGTVITRKNVRPFVRIYGDIAGMLDIRGDVGNSTSRELHCQGDVSGTLKIDGSTYVFSGVDIDGSVTGPVWIVKALRSGDHGGYVRVLRSLGSASDAGEIQLDGGLSSPSSPLQAYVCINYDGFGRDYAPDLDVWHTGSTVKLGSTTYTAPDDTARVHAAPPTCGKGDCDGSGEVDFFDIDPFVALIGFNPAAYPGRTPSVLLMADADCDLDVDFFDIDPFVALLGGGCGDPCNESFGGESMMMADPVEGVDPATLAAILNDNISDANRATLLAGVETLAQTPPDGTPIDWPAVYKALTGN